MLTTATAPEDGASATMTPRADAGNEPLMLRKRIASTTFIVNVHFSNTETETLEDKLLRLIEREVEKSA